MMKSCNSAGSFGTRSEIRALKTLAIRLIPMLVRRLNLRRRPMKTKRVKWKTMEKAAISLLIPRKTVWLEWLMKWRSKESNRWITKCLLTESSPNNKIRKRI